MPIANRAQAHAKDLFKNVSSAGNTRRQVTACERRTCRQYRRTLKRLLCHLQMGLGGLLLLLLWEDGGLVHMRPGLFVVCLPQFGHRNPGCLMADGPTLRGSQAGILLLLIIVPIVSLFLTTLRLHH